jgi:hypothetical protein
LSTQKIVQKREIPNNDAPKIIFKRWRKAYPQLSIIELEIKEGLLRVEKRLGSAKLTLFE